MPLAVHGGQAVPGTLLVARLEDAPPFDAHDERLLTAAAAQLGTAIERVRLRREATEAETLRRTDELKTALNAVSHDLRTPLASIIASAGSLRQQEIAWTSEDRDEFALTIEEEAQRLNRIAGVLLDLSRIQGGSLHPTRRATISPCWSMTSCGTPAPAAPRAHLRRRGAGRPAAGPDRRQPILTRSSPTWSRTPPSTRHRGRKSRSWCAPPRARLRSRWPIADRHPARGAAAPLHALLPRARPGRG